LLLHDFSPDLTGSPLIGRIERLKPTPSNCSPQDYADDGGCRKRGDPSQNPSRTHANRTPICLNLKEMGEIAQVAGGRHFDLR
jgi:hypothetical protein